MRIQVALLLVLFFTLSCSPRSEEPSVSIGMFTALSGNIAAVGQQELIAAEYAVEQINAQGGIDGKSLKLVVEDAKCSPRDAMTAFNNIRARTETAIILGGLCTGETMGAAPLANEQHVVLLSATSSGPQVKNAGDFVFRTNPVDDGAFFAEYAVRQGHESVGILSEHTDFAQGVKTTLLPLLEERGMAYFQEDVPSHSPDYRTALLKLKGTDLLIINSNSAIVSLEIYEQAAELGITSVIAGRGLEAAATSQLSQAEGLVFYGSFGIANASDPHILEMARRYREQYGADPVSPFPFASKYDTVMLAADAMRACGHTDGACMRDFLYGVQNRSGLLGTFGFDAHGEVTGIGYRAVRIQDGVPVLIE